jgi:hypothetical protein
MSTPKGSGGEIQINEKGFTIMIKCALNRQFLT